MKKLFTLLLALGVGLAVMTPTTTEAGDSRRPSYWQPCGYCGGPLYRQHVVYARDHRGKSVIKSWQVLPHQCHRPSYGYGQPSYGQGYPCPPHHGSRSGVSFPGFRFGFGR